MSLNKSFNILKTIAKVIFGVGSTDFLRKRFPLSFNFYKSRSLNLYKVVEAEKI